MGPGQAGSRRAGNAGDADLGDADGDGNAVFGDVGPQDRALGLDNEGWQGCEPGLITGRKPSFGRSGGATRSS